MEERADNVVVSQQAFVGMVLHALAHSDTQVHGILVGKLSKGTAHVLDAFPVCHEVPSKSLVETSLALVLSSISGLEPNVGIIGWYTVPEILSDDTCGPVALRVAASLGTIGENAVLLKLDNNEIGKALQNSDTQDASAIQAFGRDFGKQWKDNLPVTILEANKSVKALCYLREEIDFNDLVDHWRAVSTTEWTSTLSLKSEVNKYL